MVVPSAKTCSMPLTCSKYPENSWAEIEIAGVRHKASLVLAPEVRAGDWVLVNLGNVVAKIDEDEAGEIIKLYEEIAEAETF